jgi:diadenosine tetraphosphate (Ap4A) HIT family hydrolase
LLDWLNVVRVMEAALQRAFDATMFHWSCYMNLSYRGDPPDPHIHRWVVPRYRRPVEVGALTFDDPRFGSPYDHAMRRVVSEELRQQIAERLRQGIVM